MTAENVLDTLPDIADGLLDLYTERRFIDSRIKHLEQTLIEASAEFSNGLEDPWWRGRVIEGRKVAWYAAMRLVDSGPPQRWERHLYRVRS